MNTVIDVGNTRIKVGFFEGEKLLSSKALKTNLWQNIYSFFSDKHLGKCIISSTVPVPAHITSYLRAKAEIFIALDKNTPLPICNTYKTQETLGKDRIALAVGAAHIYPAENILIISAGTCVTYNLLDKTSTFVGGAISPGLHMRLQAMHTFTAQLPLAKIPEQEKAEVIGTNTYTSLLSGALNGVLFEIIGFIESVSLQYFPLKVILSGGDSRYLADNWPAKNTIPFITEPDLALKGLNQILTFNVKN